MNKNSLLASLTALDFMAVDLGLYLDTHPENKEALEEYNRIILAADKVRGEYEEEYGQLCSFRSYAKDGFNWVDEPWPWKEEFNFYIEKEERA